MLGNDLRTSKQLRMTNRAPLHTHSSCLSFFNEGVILSASLISVHLMHALMSFSYWRRPQAFGEVNGMRTSQLEVLLWGTTEPNTKASVLDAMLIKRQQCSSPTPRNHNLNDLLWARILVPINIPFWLLFVMQGKCQHYGFFFWWEGLFVSLLFRF